MDNTINNKILLKEFISKIRPDLIERLEIFIALCEAVRRYHVGKMVHNDIHFDAFHIDPITSSVEISESSLTLKLSGKKEPITWKTSSAIGGQLAYLSPERTGKTTHSVDFRSDLYSLGVVLYQLLTDALPFDFEQPRDILHAHIALPPLQVDQINPKIPRAISHIVSKLLSKSPADRYQSAAGLVFDLKKALEQLRSEGHIETFLLGQRDLSPFFEIPNKLYGRYKEVQLICDAYKQISTVKAGAVFISGPPGIGKSFLVNNLHPFLMESGGYFITGKFDQYEKTIPYSAIVQAFSGLIQRMLTLSDADLEKRRNAILKALGRNGQLIINVIPELELVIGKQPQPEKLSSLETRNRFNYLFQNFVRTVTRETGPVIIFIDDLQWADRASLELMETIILDPALGNLLFIGAYREIEAKENSHLGKYLENVTHHYHIPHQFIQLEPVDSEYIETFIKDMLSIDLDHSSGFIQLIAQKTNCNPLFIKEFLISLNKAGLIRFIQTKSDDEADQWAIDLEGIFKARLPETIVALLTQRIRKLSEETQTMLKIAACIGTKFSPDLLKAVYNRSIEVIRPHLKEALDQGIILRTKDGFEFIHDRVREAVYHLNSVEKRIRIHYAVGKALMSEEPEKRTNNIFLLVSQWNSARTQLSAQERDELIQLNLVAGKKAKEMTAFVIARDYFVIGLELLDESAWEKHYELALAFHTEAADTAYMCADFDEAEKQVLTVLKNARTDLDQLAAYGIQLSCLLSQHRFSEVLHTGIHILRRLGYRLPENPGKLRLLWELLALKFALRKKTLQQLQEINCTLNAKELALSRISSSLISTAYRTRPNLFKFIVLNRLRTSLRGGCTPDTGVYYSFYGLLLGAIGKIDRGYDFGQLALALSHHPQITPNSKVQILLPVNGVMLLWKKHFKETLQPLLETYKFCLEMGDLAAAANSIVVYFNNIAACGTPLKEILAKLDHYYEIMRQYRQQSAVEYLGDMRYQLILNFTDSGDILKARPNLYFDDDAHLAALTAANDRPALTYLYFSRTAGCYFRRNYEEAIKYSDLALKILKESPPSVIYSRVVFYNSLSRIAYIRTQAAAVQKEKKSVRRSLKLFFLKREHLAKVEAGQKKMKLWGRYAPMNLLNKWNLIEAERANLRGQKRQAEAHYLQAVELSQKYGFLPDEAISNELLARFYLEESQKEAAEEHFRTAIDLNEKWGAEIQRRQLLAEYRTLFARAIGKTENGSIETNDQYHERSSEGLTMAEMDLQFFSDVIDTISSNISIKNRLAAISEHLMRHIGAQRVLLLVNRERLFVGVDNEIGKNTYTLKPVKGDLLFPEFIIQYVIRTLEPVILDHAAKAEMFLSDPYIHNNEAKSVICIPLTYQNRLEALLYLENNLSTGVFTQQHVEILTRLGGQIALLLQNEFFKKGDSADGRSLLLPEQLVVILQDRFGLTPQEAKIASLFRDGHTRDQICKMLSISAPTLRKHLQTIFNKTVNLEEKYSDGSGRVDKLSRLILFLFKQTF